MYDDSAAKRFWAKVQPAPDGDCWNWVAANYRGYGTFWFKGANVRAYRWAYEYLVAPIPDGLTLDHLCRNPRCVNPGHLEPVPAAVNTLRSNNPPAVNARRTHCARGHEFTAANTRYRHTEGGRRLCRTCHAERARKRYAARRSA